MSNTEERTERIIQLIDFLVASPKVESELKRFILDEFTGQIITRSVFLTKCRCVLADCRKYDVACIHSDLIQFYEVYTSQTEAAARWRAEVELW